MLSIQLLDDVHTLLDLPHADHVAGQAVALGEEHLLEIHLAVNGVGMALAHVAGHPAARPVPPVAPNEMASSRVSAGAFQTLLRDDVAVKISWYSRSTGRM